MKLAYILAIIFAVITMLSMFFYEKDIAPGKSVWMNVGKISLILFIVSIVYANINILQDPDIQ